MSRRYQIIIDGPCVHVLRETIPQPQMRPNHHVTAKCICGGNLILRKNKYTGQEFLGCTNFPYCTNTITISSPTPMLPHKKGNCGFPVDWEDYNGWD